MSKNKDSRREQTLIYAIQELENVIDKIKTDSSIGLDIEGVRSVTIDHWKSENYKIGGKIHKVDEFHLGELEQKAPSQNNSEHINTVIEAIVVILKQALDEDTEPDTIKIKGLIDQILPLGGWANFAFNILAHFNILLGNNTID
jgi:hypothetical protein